MMSSFEESINKIFLIPPKQGQNENQIIHSDTLKLIETKAKLRAKCLAEEKRMEIDSYLNEILY